MHEDVKASVKRAKDEAKCPRVAAASMCDELESREGEGRARGADVDGIPRPCRRVYLRDEPSSPPLAYGSQIHAWGQACSPPMATTLCSSSPCSCSAQTMRRHFLTTGTCRWGSHPAGHGCEVAARYCLCVRRRDTGAGSGSAPASPALLTKGNTGIYRNTLSATGLIYVPDVDEGIVVRNKIAMASFQ
jgi:hypothetical protein